MSKHTPGPWHIGTSLERHRANIWSQTEAVTSVPYSGDTEQANANLIAAAPELLEALGDALRELEDDTCVECGQQWDECECPNGDWWRKARAAIAKAKGETK